MAPKSLVQFLKQKNLDDSMQMIWCERHGFNFKLRCLIIWFVKCQKKSKYRNNWHLHLFKGSLFFVFDWPSVYVCVSCVFLLHYMLYLYMMYINILMQSCSQRERGVNTRWRNKNAKTDTIKRARKRSKK